jgi:hypothetical protein
MSNNLTFCVVDFVFAIVDVQITCTFGMCMSVFNFTLFYVLQLISS